jgi:hypothetical protein
MPLGILDDNKLEHVPGTAPLSELHRIDLEVAGVDRGFLKHDASGKIVLVPQPSDSPNDPYNWPRWKKEMFTLVIAYGCGCVGGKNFAAPINALVLTVNSHRAPVDTCFCSARYPVRCATPDLHARV